jgi:plasmid stability protein
MAKMIQIRNVPDDLHRVLKSRAAQAGMSLSDYLLKEVRQVAQRPTLEEVMQRIHRRGSPGFGFDSAAEVRAEREGRR